MGGLIVIISLRETMAHPRFFMVVPISKHRFTVHIHLKEESEIDEELMALIALSRR